LPKELIKMEIEEISSVDRPATGKKFVLIKRDAEGDIEKRTLEDVLDNEEARKEVWKSVEAFYEAVRFTMYDDSLDAEQKAEEISASTDQLASRMNEIAPDLAKRLDIETMEKQALERLSNKGGGNMTIEELLAKVEDEDIRKSIKTEFEELEKRVEDLEKESIEEGEESSLDKAEMPEELRKRFEDMEKKAAKAEELAKKEREKRLTVEFNKKAKEYDKVGEVDKIASILRKASELGDEVSSDLQEILSSAQERLSNADLFKESGDGGENVSDAESRLDKETKKLMEKDPDLTYAKAQKEVLEKNADLYVDYVNQR